MYDLHSQLLTLKYW